MTARDEKEALEAVGFVRVTTLWVFPEDLAAIYKIASKHGPRVHEIKKQVRKARGRNNKDRALRDPREHSLRQERKEAGEAG